MAEAMATGTPVIAARFGAVPEVVLDGETGIICDSVEEMALSCRRIGSLDRAACRARVSDHFSVARMADGYEAVYRSVLQDARHCNETCSPKSQRAEQVPSPR